MAEVKFSQRADVLNHLRVFGSITSWEAIKEYGATRLSSIVYDLRKQGWNIGGEMIESKNRYGNPVKYKRYILEAEQRIPKKPKVILSERQKQTLFQQLLNKLKGK